MKMDVVELKTVPDWNMQVRFADGTQGSVKFEQSHLCVRIFERSNSFFPGISGFWCCDLAWQY